MLRQPEPSRTQRLIVAAGVLAACCVFAAIFFNLPDQLILFPSTQAIDPHAAIQKTVPFENGEVELWTARSRRAQQLGRPEIYMLRFYGNADRAERWVTMEAEMWNDRAIEIWGMNYPGFGGSSGPARLKRIAPATVAAFEALQHEAENRPIVLFGASIGSAPALHIAAHRPVAGLILHNPPPLQQLILRQYGWWNLWVLAGPVAAQIPSDLDSIANARAVHARAIFVLAEQDEIVAPRFQRLVVDAYAGEKRVITLRGAYHNSPIEATGLADLYKALDWLLRANKN